MSRLDNARWQPKSRQVCVEAVDVKTTEVQR